MSFFYKIHDGWLLVLFFFSWHVNDKNIFFDGPTHQKVTQDDIPTHLFKLASPAPLLTS